MKIGIVIPARLESKRLPQKVLLDFAGMPMVEHVWRRAQLVNPKIPVAIATDSKIIKNHCKSFGAKCLITSKTHPNGLSRVGEVSKKLNWDFYIILQADEILIDPENLSTMVKLLKNKSIFTFYNLTTKIENFAELRDSNVVKCITRKDGTIIDIFRKSPLTCSNKIQLEIVKKICGVFAISKETLSLLLSKPMQDVEKLESIEQMKAIELGIDIASIEIAKNYPSVNTKHEKLVVNRILKNDLKQKKILDKIKN